MKYKVLILTDHRNHSAENSLYELSIKMLAHRQTECIDIASRENSINESFFSCSPYPKLYGTSITKDFVFNVQDHALSKDFKEVDLETYDMVWLRMPPPMDTEFLEFINNFFPKAVIINNPMAITETGSKEFLMNFQSVCPPMKICNSLEDITEFSSQFAIVLKPFNEYGGRGIVKIEGDKVSFGKEHCTLDEFSKAYAQNPIDYLAVKYLKNVKQGDKRIVVVNGEILGASLRLPSENSWLCNVAMGGSSNRIEVEPEEEAIIKLINPILTQRGIVMYGVDTLVGDDGKRVLSEINTTSIGGLPQIAAMQQEPLVEKAIDLIWKYFNNENNQHEQHSGN